MIELVRCTQAHLDRLSGRGRDRCEVLPTNLEFASVLLVDGRPIAAGGMVRVWDCCFTAWAIVTPEAAKDHALSLHRSARRMMEMAENILGARRVTALVEADFQTGIEWLQVLGFELEGRFDAYGPGAKGDYVQMRWLWRP